ncbi:hypothetical protein OsJ_29051 [Oryza sativa Japonica Group]|uniref:Uncharacterized protein n=1 Tax=Oryza sativa subsp. japonica TaxID=39947 RepID=A3BXZ9_ORYSJ|nr:hypothetical protein OsJ_29051 [Oryza sativa Japonica Group]
MAGGVAAAQRHPPSARSGGRKGATAAARPSRGGKGGDALPSTRSGRRGGAVAADDVEAATPTFRRPDCGRGGGGGPVAADPRGNGGTVANLVDGDVDSL